MIPQIHDSMTLTELLQKCGDKKKKNNEKPRTEFKELCDINYFLPP